MTTTKKLALALALLTGSAPAAYADSISPPSFTASLGVGESVTLSKTVTIDAGGPDSALIDVVFLIDTSGSMGSIISAAKAAAVDLIAGLNAFGDLASGSGYYSDPGSDGLYRALTTNDAQQVQNINDINLLLGGGGGDFPEEGFNAVKQAAEGSAWREGSNRFIVALGDATFKESDGATQANTIDALLEANATFIGLNFSNMTNTGIGGLSPQGLATGSGGSILASSIGSSAIIDTILEGISGSFSEYSSVTLSDFGDGLPGVGVTVICTGADSGTCEDEAAIGSFDRSTSRTFTFDVTFTGLADGDHSFLTRALVDGGVVGSEADRIIVGGGTGEVPEPTSLALLALGLLGCARGARRQATRS